MSLVVVRALGLVTVQDLGRTGLMHDAVPPGGALVPELRVAANRRAQTRDDAAAIEIAGQLVVRADRALEVATDRASHHLAAGEQLTVSSEPRRVTYLAVRGGVAAPVVLGARGALLCAGLGGLLRAGDRIETSDAVAPDTPAPMPFSDDDHITVLPGPDLDAFEPDALAILTASRYRVLPTSDRVGTRLAGASIPRRAIRDLPRPMVRGAIEVPPDGAPIVLGPEHPTTGSYPIIAVVAHADLGRLFAIRLGGELQFATGVASASTT